MRNENSAGRITKLTIFLLFPLAALLMLYFFGESWLRHLLLYLSGASWARQLVSKLPPAQRVARRFVAGETIQEALQAARALNESGMLVTMDYLGESVTSADEAIDARDEILRLLDEIHSKGINANVSVKLSQLGLKIDPQIAFDNIYLLLERARQAENKIRIDMEESQVVDVTLEMYRSLRDYYHFNNVGVVIQSYLYRSEADVAQLVAEGAWVRLCKGAYMEPPEVAFAHKQDTDNNYVKLTQMLLSQEARNNGVYLGVATHDEAMVQAALDYAQANQLKTDEFEFQMLYGVRRDLQESLVQQGNRVRIYVPYGQAWYPYFVRRLAERPANLWFFISNFLRR